MSSRQLSPLELGIEDADLKATANTKYASGVKDVRHAFAFTAIVDVTEVGGGSNGEAKLTVQVLDKDKTTVLYALDLLTAIDTTTTNRNVVTFGYGVTPIRVGTATLSTDADILKVAKFVKVILEVTTQADGTSSSGSVNLLIEQL